MGIFDRKPSPQEQVAITLRESIRNRGQAQIPEASAAVDSFVKQVLAKANATKNDQARIWVLDRIRFFFVTILGGQTFDLLKGMDIPELPELEAEWGALATNPGQYGAAHLLAWIWLLNRSIFEPVLQEQFRQMEGVLVEAVCGISGSGNDFASQLIDWGNFFRS
jgi:hypothetical protein